MGKQRFGFFTVLLAITSASALYACGDDTGTNTTNSTSSSSSASGTGGAAGTGGMGGGSGGTGGVEDLVMTEADFTCILKWDQVRLFRITNLLGKQTEALAAANAPGTMDYPVGTVIQLVPNEAMVKRAKGFSTDSNDWEFFFLDTTAAGTTITKRGVTDVTNQAGANCLNCHKLAMPQYDFVCEKSHGCDALPFTDDQILGVQNGDPRCTP